MLYTNLQHLNTKDDVRELISNHENVMICCGRMGPMCIPVYKVMEKLETEYTNVKFADMLFDLPDAEVIRNLDECQDFMGLPFTVYYKNGKLVNATSSLQSEEQIREILNESYIKN